MSELTLPEDQAIRIREFLARSAKKVKVTGWVDGEPWRWAAVSVYGWQDWDASEHMRPYDKDVEPCRWIIAPGAEVHEVTYSQFADTFTGNEDEVGLNVYPASCACGKYTDVMLRWTGSLTTLMSAVFGVPANGGFRL
jgi:hypothetical protein